MNSQPQSPQPAVKTGPARPRRNYDRLIASLSLPSTNASREERMQICVDAVWDAYAPMGVSWVGFYEKTEGAEEMTLAVRRDKPACSPIGLHGACGRGWSTKRMLVVTDVAHLGEGYIACDPRDRAEVVVPMLNEDGSCWGVLDVDSFDVNAFDADDARGLWKLCLHLGLTAQPLVARLPAPIGIDVV